MYSLKLISLTINVLGKYVYPTVHLVCIIYVCKLEDHKHDYLIKITNKDKKRLIEFAKQYYKPKMFRDTIHYVGGCFYCYTYKVQ
jgi:hypothetical protein